MKHTLQQIFHSPKFVIGFAMFMIVLLIVIFYPLFVPGDPLAIIGLGTFFEPGTYVNTYDAITSKKYILNLDDVSAERIAAVLGDEERLEMKDWLLGFGIPESEIDIGDTEKLLAHWQNNYDPTLRFEGMTSAKRKYFVRLNTSIEALLATKGVTIASENEETGVLEEIGSVGTNDYVNVQQVANVRVLPLGTDNFGRDMLDRKSVV